MSHRDDAEVRLAGVDFLNKLFELSILLLLAWGSLAFGAEYAWAYTPLLVFCFVPALLGLRDRRGTLPSGALLATLAAVLVFALIQWSAPARLIPAGVQSGTPGVDFERLYARVLMQTPPATDRTLRLSIAPSRTLLGVAFLTALSFFLAGCTRAISAIGPSRLVRGIVVIGVVTAFVGIVQSRVRAELVYGFWRPPRLGVPFAPFMNENHFAGWMAMVISLGVGLFAGDVARAFPNVDGWRNRLLWFSSPQANRMVLTAFAIVIMALSMVLTFSRGGLVGLLAVCVIASWWMMRRQSGARRIVAGACVVAIVFAAAMWGGAENTVGQFSGAVDSLGGRKAIWTDTLKMASDYPVTGTGLNTFGIGMLHYQTTLRPTAVAEAHNDYLQLAAEGGVLLGIPIIIALVILVRDIWKRFAEGRDDARTSWLRAGAVTGLCAIAVMEIFDFTLQMPGAAAMFVVLVAIAIHQPNHLERR